MRSADAILRKASLWVLLIISLYFLTLQTLCQISVAYRRTDCTTPHNTTISSLIGLPMFGISRDIISFLSSALRYMKAVRSSLVNVNSQIINDFLEFH